MSDNFNLDEKLIQFNDELGTSNWTIRDAVEGVQIFGGIGSGKTSGSGRMIALKYLKAGFGGLVLTVKEEEKNDWIEYCRLTGRLGNLITVEPGGDYFFNFLNYESSKTAAGSSVSQNLVQVLKTVIRASADKAGHGSDDSFWEKALDMLISNTIDLCILAIDLVKLLPATCKEKSIRQMLINTSDIASFELAGENKQLENKFVIGHTEIKIHTNDATTFSELISFSGVEKLVHIIECANVMGVDIRQHAVKILGNDSSIDNLHKSYISFIKKHEYALL